MTILKRIWKALSRKVSDESGKSELAWVEVSDSPWGIRIIDIRPIALGVTSASKDPQCATNAVSFSQDDGLGFVGETPAVSRTIEVSLEYVTDGDLADGVLFTPRVMEHKWAMFFHKGQIICVRSWLRQVFVVADTRQDGDRLRVTGICGAFWSEDEDPQHTAAIFDYLIRSHALGEQCPAPLPEGLESDPQSAAMWCFSMFGNLAQFAASEQPVLPPTSQPLRSSSLLHIAVTRGDLGTVDQELAKGVPIDLLAGDGLPPMHWALAQEGAEMLRQLLRRGASVDQRSDQGATPLMTATQSGDTGDIKFLLQEGAEVDACDDRDFTSLHRAAEMGHLEVARVLLEFGADCSRESAGQSPLSLARSKGHEPIVELFEEFGFGN